MHAAAFRFAWMCCLFWVGAACAQDVSCLGNIEPGERVIQLAAPADSIVGELRVKRGDHVKPGDVVALLRDAPVYRAQIEKAVQQVALAESELAQVHAGERPELVDAQEAVIEAARSEALMLQGRLERYEALLKDKHVDQDRYDEIASQLASLKAKIKQEECVRDSLRQGRTEDITQAEIAVRKANAEEAEVRALFELQQIRAPINGEILEIQTWPGESTGENGTLMSLGDTDHMMVVAEVYETDLPRVALGQKATITGQTFAGEQTGQVVEIQKLLSGSTVFPMDPSSYVDRRVVTVRIQPDNPSALAAFSRAQVLVKIHVP